MAIIIPSKRIYEIDNPKVLENALKSIDIKQKTNRTFITNENTERLSQNLDKIAGTSATTTVETYDISKTPPENIVYGAWTFNSTVTLPTTTIEQAINFTSNGMEFTSIKIDSEGIAYLTAESGVYAYSNSGGWSNENLRIISVADLQKTSAEFWSLLSANGVWKFQLMVGGKIETNVFTSAENLTFQRKRDGYYVTKIAPTINVKFDVKVTEIGAESIWTPDNPHFIFYDDKEIRSRETTTSDYTYDTESTDFNYKEKLNKKTSLSILPDRIFADFSITSGEDLIQSAKWAKVLSMINPYYPYKVAIVNETTDSFDLKIRLVDKVTVWVAQGYIFSAELGNFGSPFAPNAIKVELTYKSSEIVYNESVRRLETTESDLTLDYVAAKGEATYSLGDNQFIRAETEYNGAEGATTTLYNKTLVGYQNGKETANLRCSINEYFDENDNIVISTQTANKMIFDLYDEVVPMLLNEWGEDAPISYNKQGLAKTFKVVGIGKIGDGAVWQNLTLREFGAIAIKVKLPKPILTLNGKTLEIFDKSGKAEQFAIYVDGTLATTISANSLDIDTLNLNGGTHRIYAIAKAAKYKDSDKSRAVSFTKRYTNVRIVENESGGLTYIIESNDYHAYNGEYKIGGVL